MKKDSFRYDFMAVALIVLLFLVSCSTTKQVGPADKSNVIEPVVAVIQPVTENVVADVQEVIDKVEEKNTSDFLMDIHGQSVKASLVSADTIKVEYPSFVSDDVINGAIPEIYKNFEYYLAGATYSIKDSSVTVKLAYNITEDEFSKYMPFIEGLINDYVSSYLKKQADSARMFDVRYNKAVLDVRLVDDGSVVITYPSSVTVDDIFSVAEIAEKKYPEFLRNAAVHISDNGSVSINFGHSLSVEEFKSLEKYLQSLFDEYAFAKKKQAVKDTFKAVEQTVTETVAKSIEKPVEKVTEKVSDIIEKQPEVVAKTESIIADAKEESSSFLKNTWGKVSSFFGNLNFKKKAKDAYDKVDMEEVKNFAESIPDTARKVADDTKPFLSDFWSFIKEVTVIAYDWVIANPIYAGIGAFVLLVLIIIIVRSHKKDDDEEDD